MVRLLSVCLPMAFVWVEPVNAARGVSTYALRTTDKALGLDRMAGATAYPIVESLNFQANFADGPAFWTTGVAKHEEQEGTVRLESVLEGPAAAQASVSAEIRKRPRSVDLKWTIKYGGQQKDFNHWTTGFTLEYAEPIKGAHAVPVTKFVHPTGEKPYEVRGDTPYRDMEWQLREVAFDHARLVIATPWYDPDWIYARNLQRATFMRAGAPKAGSQITHEFLLFVLPPNHDCTPADLAAEASGRPISLSVTSDQTGNLFTPGSTVRFAMRLRNVSEEPQQGSLEWKLWDYYGKELVGNTEPLRLTPGLVREIRVAVPKAKRGILFLSAALRAGAREWFDRTTFGVLPDRPLDGPKPESPFGLAALIANPQSYPDQRDLEQVLQLAQRVGVRWLRGAAYPLKPDPSDEDERRAREQVALLAKYGLSLHVQIGSEVPRPENLEEFKAKLRATLSRFKWVTPYIEIGNELNFNTSAPDYVKEMLEPIHEVSREAFAGCKIMTMGLGGVHKDWLEAFVASGGMKLVDVLSVHPGCHPRAPEFWEGWRGWVFRPQMLDALEAAEKAGGKEVWITEAYAPTPPTRSGLDVRTAADYLVRTYVVSLALGTRVIEWYQFQDGVWFGQRPNPEDIEYNFGIVYTDLTPKPGYLSYGVMTEQLEGARYEGRMDLGAEDLYGIRFARRGRSVDVLWSYREKHETDLAWWPLEQFKDASRKGGEPWAERWQQPVEVSFPATGRVIVTDLMGNQRKVAAKDGKVPLKLTGSPIYVTGLADVALRQKLW